MARAKGSPKVGGRQKGTPNKTTASMKAAIQDVYDALQEKHGGGHKHFLDWAEQQPTEFYKIASKLLPLQVTGEGGGPVSIIFERVIVDPARDA